MTLYMHCTAPPPPMINFPLLPYAAEGLKHVTVGSYKEIDDLVDLAGTRRGKTREGRRPTV